ncbi:hypothetical protein SDC9_209366 [bioreactor metagenome]|uniref:Uncharacterized protein n=1 Tax=bioreactor metagenome TaxID=1076179 RepID=A0A645JD52_9ZZZZ
MIKGDVAELQQQLDLLVRIAVVERVGVCRSGEDIQKIADFEDGLLEIVKATNCRREAPVSWNAHPEYHGQLAVRLG